LLSQSDLSEPTQPERLAQNQGQNVQQILSVWDQLDGRRRIIVIGATAIVMIGVLALTRLAAQPNYALLYSGLSQKSSGEVLAALDAQGVAYDVRNSAIYVDSAQRDALRLTLAAEGLPAGDVNGYELLDTLSGFGTTSQMFDAAYMRAKEGELARTILANPQISAARVHIAQTDSSPFRRTSAPTASVSLRGTGGTISDDAAEAIRFLVASAVSGLQPDNVSIINADLGTVIAQDDTASPQRLGLDRAAVLKQNVERIIEARTGIGKSVVEVNVETLTDDEVIRERRFDPNGRVVVSTQTQETSRSSQNSQNGDVTVASNLPDGDAAGGDQSNSQDAETQETVNYELSETTRELRKMPGSIKRISVAVLVDGIEQVDDAGQTQTVARPDAELAMLEDLVKSAVGYDEARGDSVTIRSMDLPAPLEVAGDAEAPGWATGRPLDIVKLAQLGVTAAVVLALGLFVVRPILVNAMTNANALPAPGVAEALPPRAQDLIGEIDAPFGTAGGAAAPGLPAPPGGIRQIASDTGEQDPVERLKALIDERQDETVEILRSWIETPEGTA
jgi:flagellar M-ring protein FliF